MQEHLAVECVHVTNAESRASLCLFSEINFGNAMCLQWFIMQHGGPASVGIKNVWGSEQCVASLAFWGRP